MWLCCHFLFFFFFFCSGLWRNKRFVFQLNFCKMIQRKTAQTFRNQLDKVFLTLFCTLVILTPALVDWIEIAKKKNKIRNGKRNGNSDLQQKIHCYFDFLSTRCKRVCVQPKCCIFWFLQHRWFMPFMKSVVWNATHLNDDFSLFWAKSTWKS